MQAPVVRKVDKAINWINRYPADSVVCFVNSYLWHIVIYLVDGVIQPSNIRGQIFSIFCIKEPFSVFQAEVVLIYGAYLVFSLSEYF